MKTRNCRKIFMVLTASVLCLLAGLFISPMKAEAATKAKVVLEFTDGTKKTWKTGDSKIKLGKKTLAYVYFGEYPQTEVTGKKLTKAIKNADYDENGIAKVKGVKYKRINREDATNVFDSSERGFVSHYDYDWAGKDYSYFMLEPIKWRVLSNKKGTVLLLSEYGLDDQKYNEKYVDITWEECTLRTWLNDTFLKSAFNAKERKLIKTTTLVNADNNDAEGGKNTKDKVYLLSLSDIVKFIFDDNLHTYDIKRRCSLTDFAKAMGAVSAYGTDDYTKTTRTTEEGKWAGIWWLRSPGTDNNMAMYVPYNGYIDSLGSSVDDGLRAVRPALQLNLSSVIG